MSQKLFNQFSRWYSVSKWQPVNFWPELFSNEVACEKCKLGVCIEIYFNLWRLNNMYLFDYYRHSLKYNPSYRWAIFNGIVQSLFAIWIVLKVCYSAFWQSVRERERARGGWRRGRGKENPKLFQNVCFIWSLLSHTALKSVFQWFHLEDGPQVWTLSDRLYSLQSFVGCVGWQMYI